jgi:hypothetical protein
MRSSRPGTVFGLVLLAPFIGAGTACARPALERPATLSTPTLTPAAASSGHDCRTRRGPLALPDPADL